MPGISIAGILLVLVAGQLAAADMRRGSKEQTLRRFADDSPVGIDKN